MPTVSTPLTLTQLQHLANAAGKLLSNFGSADATVKDGLSSLKGALASIPDLTDASAQVQGAVRADGSITVQFNGVDKLKGVTFIVDPSQLSGTGDVTLAIEYQPGAAIVNKTFKDTPLAGLAGTVHQPAIIASNGATTSVDGIAVGKGLNLIETV
ncbi:MAG: hypothetical protein K2P77_12960, partial [Burkholderiaceae bacterium]|nr:hypothetical protein [Burkholderiaceae bacterium]